MTSFTLASCQLADGAIWLQRLHQLTNRELLATSHWRSLRLIRVCQRWHQAAALVYADPVHQVHARRTHIHELHLTVSAPSLASLGLGPAVTRSSFAPPRPPSFSSRKSAAGCCARGQELVSSQQQKLL